MRRFEAHVRVVPREGVLDPQGQAVAGALRALGFQGVRDARVGRWIRLDLEAESEASARAAVEAMCRRLLANPVIEDFAFELRPAGRRRRSSAAEAPAGAAGEAGGGFPGGAVPPARGE